jgi:murein tripeptide amidase MpaA
MAPVSALIDSNFHGGAITVVSADDVRAIELRLRPDNASEFAQWFYFRVHAPRGVEQVLHIRGVETAAFPKGWPDYRACVSADGEDWRRTNTSFDGSTLTIRHTPTTDVTAYAYFAPYSAEDTQRLIGRAARDPRVSVDILGLSLENAPIHRLVVKDPTNKGGRPPLWLVARQHPGETMSGFFLEGFLARLLDPTDSAARALLASVDVHIVPDINPDGSRRGNLRTNFAGANLNREWDRATPEYAPEVLAVRTALEATGASQLLDLHGDEALPYVHFIPADMPAPLLERRAKFEGALLVASSDFQTEHSSTLGGPNNPRLLSHWATRNLDCLALTLEQPFKDNALRPDPIYGWSPARARRLGVDMLTACCVDLVK